MAGPEVPQKNPEVIPSNEKSITIDAKNGTIGHVAAELGISMVWLKGFVGNYSARPKTLIAENYLTPGKGESKYEERYWSEPRNGDKYIFRGNEDQKTGATLIRIRGKEIISIPIPLEAINKKAASIEELQDNTRLQLASLMQDINTQTA